jgi:hypothetical protein
LSARVFSARTKSKIKNAKTQLLSQPPQLCNGGRVNREENQTN